MSEIARLDEKLNQFINVQSEFNTNINRNLEKLSEAMMQNQAQQVEINQLTGAIQKLDQKYDDSARRISDIEVNQALSIQFRKEVNHLKWATFGSGMSLFVGVVIFVVKNTFS